MARVTTKAITFHIFRHIVCQKSELAKLPIICRQNAKLAVAQLKTGFFYKQARHGKLSAKVVV